MSNEEVSIVDGCNVVLYVWYDNEFGYSAQVIRLVQHMAHAGLPSFPDSAEAFARQQER
ncbi:hypothetical protein [Kushneria aurantia]|uniref:Glyceraldehyde-3-phosphate dehydrogenase n=1 Tax=Kushneria aurantia TaxID=504092 RepID=A0ABV6G800_9GAMM|nr:hypothetical protein [Kushneria aurantia]